MNKLKKGKTLLKKNEVPKKFIYIKSGIVSDSKTKYSSNNFIGFIPFLLQIPIISSYKVVEDIEYEEYEKISDISEENMNFLLKDISKNYISLAYYGLTKKFPNPEEVFLCKSGKTEKEYAVEDDEDVIDFIDNFDFLMNVEEVEVPKKFDEFESLLKQYLQEFSIMKFVNLLKSALNEFEEEQWEPMLLELFDRIITMEDRALMLYVVYIAAMKFNDVKIINKFLKKNWEVLRFHGKNNWLDYAMSYMNNKIFLSEANK
ncbi:hypothetical protein OSSY52_10210 [Tepiditoga spiralis]|uniref:Cyclic nucleotide-binding domain-containing protein n=1 Tax=Tepiditoga spiralis TaxID=2108365 RepID=A0A7G1G3A9_9BACT|nr:hypothetical protein [Tepiditoga spiralis]BBE30880.1 hypothetical protein OSSY52_10210 [Tepiditoga spiralis]